ncbi:MAG: MBL fold metallo-hydrolase [Acidimicrobiia bacterium]
MKFKVIGHSCMYAETSGPSILVDPWLIGSCYWRSWWHYPPVPDPPEAELLSADYVYLTHHHFDHFHFPSMRKIHRDAHILVPKFGVPTLADEVRNLGFHEVMELPHGQVVQLAPGVRVASYQNGPDDSAFVIADGDKVLVDINDGKIRGRTLKKIREEFGTPTFVLKSYSFAQAYPVCYTADDPADLELITRDTYIDDWMLTMDVLQPKYAVPFGSMVSFLHPQSRHLNPDLVIPSEVVDAYKRHRPDSVTEALVMDPGDSWSSETGFDLAGIDWYTDKQKHLDELQAKVQPKLDAQAAAEEGVTLDYATFAAYFTKFMHAFPPGVLGRFALKRPVVFTVPSSPLPFWVLDFKRRAVYRLSEAPPDTASIISVDEAILADAIEKRLMHLVHGSMRISVHVKAGGAGDDLTFWGLLVPWELGYAPIHKSVGPRLAGVTWRRRDEWLEYVDSLRGGGGSLFERLSDRFATPSEVAHPNGR